MSKTIAKIKIDGVIEKEGETYNQKWLLEIIHSGKNKTMGSLSEPVTEEQRQIMQTISDECYEQFTSIL